MYEYLAFFISPHVFQFLTVIYYYKKEIRGNLRINMVINMPVSKQFTLRERQNKNVMLS